MDCDEEERCQADIIKAEEGQLSEGCQIEFLQLEILSPFTFNANSYTLNARSLCLQMKTGGSKQRVPVI